MVLPADKGRTSIVMDTETYHSKMSTLIKNGPYQLLHKDPTDHLTWKVVGKATNLEAKWISIRGCLQQHQT